MLSLSVVETCTKCPWWSTTCTRFPIQNRLVFGYYCANCDRKSVTHQSSKNAQRQVHLQISCQAARLPLQKFSTPTPSIASLLATSLQFSRYLFNQPCSSLSLWYSAALRLTSPGLRQSPVCPDIAKSFASCLLCFFPALSNFF